MSVYELSDGLIHRKGDREQAIEAGLDWDGLLLWVASRTNSDGVWKCDATDPFVEEVWDRQMDEAHPDSTNHPQEQYVTY